MASKIGVNLPRKFEAESPNCDFLDSMKKESALKDWIIENCSKNKSFQFLNEKSKFVLVGKVAKEIQRIFENKGEEFFAGYQAELGPILQRANWIYSKDPKFIFRRWNAIKAQVQKTLAGKDQLVKPAPEVIHHQVNALRIAVAGFVQGHQINSPRPEKDWVKKTRGGWMKNPRKVEVI